ncbi:hypothetical protein GCM10011344_41250 [Dokdonia pacifica]|uniref:Uncharacterized protein n=1 Tax=Dokdonia pacifica TaxID=1627892 RepID=A0A239ADU6_9FLAO|nr:hypothetical protein [Dokdonia pacifica]GGG36111.1 hypothetical protein GCM10011344_41250 [Dokdonia pacifica]SNR93073.1 hypothetical protein SAMN06265376_104311 [Dokdonia pacifica]
MSKALTVNTYSFVIPEKDDPCDLWIGYFDALKKAVGSAHAKTLWLITWKKTGAVSCTSRPAFNTWMDAKGLDVSNIATRTLSDLSEIQANFFGLGKNLTKTIAIGIPVLLIALIIGILVIGKKAVDSTEIEDIKMLTPVGRASKLLSK